MSADGVIQIILVTPDGRILTRRPVQKPHNGLSVSIRRNGLPWQVTISKTYNALDASEGVIAAIDKELKFYFNNGCNDLGVLRREWVGWLDRQTYGIFSLKLKSQAKIKSTLLSETRLLSFSEIKEEMAGNSKHKYVHHAIIAFNQLLTLRRQKDYGGAF